MKNLTDARLTSALAALTHAFPQTLTDPEIDKGILSGSILLDARDPHSPQTTARTLTRTARAHTLALGMNLDERLVWMEFWMEP